MTESESDISATSRPKRPRPARQRPPVRHANGNVDALAEMQARLDALETGRMRTVESEPYNTIPAQRVVDDEELTEWQREIRRGTQTKDPASMVRKEPNYNIPTRWYMKGDGTIVSLQGDAKNLAYYTDVKGFHVLSDAEARHYLKTERPRIVKVQRAKASVINNIRRAVRLDPVLESGLDPSWETDLDKMTISELRAQYDEIAGSPTSDGRPRRTFKRPERLQDEDDRKAMAEAERLLKGVEVNAMSMERFNSMLGRDIEVTPRNADQFA